MYDVEVPMYDSKTDSGMPHVVDRPVPVLLPSAILTWSYTHFQQKFQRHILGSHDGASCVSFWQHTRGDDEAASHHKHPAFEGLYDHGSLSKVVPWATHGDGVPIGKQGTGSPSLTVISQGSLTGVGAIIDTL